MERVNRICHHPLWRESMERIRELEQNRIFCRHDTAHCMDVARLAYLENLKNHLGLEQGCIYAAALLHDVGRHLQYLEGIPHEQGSAALARPILADCGYSPAEQEEIVSAILRHRMPETVTQSDLAGLLYRADKASRLCMFCGAAETCNWSQEKKNMTLKI